MPRSRGEHGLTLLEMAVALAVLAAIVAALVPTLLSTAGSSRADATLAEMAQLYDAILGDQRETFGYVGDVGTYPVNLRDLAISNGATGWKGPYVGNARIENNRLIDPYGQPYEYYLVSGISGSDQLAIVSRGPDGLSANSPADPNLGASFSPAPSSGTYSAAANNADNIVYPAVNGNTNALNVEIAGTLALNISNFDSNALVNAFVPACPNLYRVTITSQTRGTNEVTNLGYAPGFQVDLPQGIYQVLVTAQNLSAAPFNEKLTVIPGQTVTRSPNVTGLDSSGTDQFVLTVTNKQPSEGLRVYQFATLLTPNSGSSPIAANATATFAVRACAQAFIKAATSTAIRDQVVMPWSNVTKIVGATSSSIAVTNNTANSIRMFNSGIFFGEIKKGKSQTFTVGLTAGDTAEARTTAGAVLKTLVLAAGANTMIVP
jgi:prepilin-type N-terminal cleavage/methylation domain-containing protein